MCSIIFPRKGRWDLSRMPTIRRVSKKQVITITMEHTDSVVMRGKTFDQKGPDLGFLRLPQENIGWIAAVGRQHLSDRMS